MGCNCGKSKQPKQQPTSDTQQSAGQTQQFSLRTTDGRTLTFGSRLERDAARVRLGGAVIRSG